MRVFIFLLLSVSIFSCEPDSNEEPSTENNCRDILISESKFQEIDYNQASILEYEIIDDCLKVKLGVGGCDEDHEIDLITDGGINESLPPQITFVFKDNDLQPCNAYFQIDREFDLTPIRTSLGLDEDVYLTFQLSDDKILYKK